MSRAHLPGILAMAITVVASNILVQFLFGQWLTWGAFTYPLAFLVTDLMNRVYGAGPARKVVFIGFLVGVACSLIGTQIVGGVNARKADTTVAHKDKEGQNIELPVFGTDSPPVAMTTASASMTEPDAVVTRQRADSVDGGADDAEPAGSGATAGASEFDVGCRGTMPVTVASKRMLTPRLMA